MQLIRIGPGAALLLVATVALLATVLARPPSLASARQVETAPHDSVSVSDASLASHAGWSGSKKLSALDRVTVGDNETPQPNNQGDEPPEPGDAEEPPEPGDASEAEEPVEPDEPDEPSEPEEPPEPEEPSEPEEPAEPQEPEEPAESEDSAEAGEPSRPVASPDTGAGLLEQQITVSLFLAVVLVIGALLAVAYRRR